VRTRADRGWVKALIGLAPAAVVAGLGVPLGAAWATVAPRLPGVVQKGGVYLADVEGEQRAAEESWYILLSIGAGILLALLAWGLLRRFRGPIMILALGVGGVAGGWLAWWFGRQIGRAHALALARTAKVGTIIEFPVDLRIKQPGNVAWWHSWLPHIGGVLMSLALAAVGTYVTLTLMSTSPSLYARGRPKPPPPPL
jgi:membrane protein YqaA with SNARE-associated domain